MKLDDIQINSALTIVEERNALKAENRRLVAEAESTDRLLTTALDTCATRLTELERLAGEVGQKDALLIEAHTRAAGCSCDRGYPGSCGCGHDIHDLLDGEVSVQGKGS